MKPPSRVLAYIDSHYWAMHRPAYESLREIVAMRAAGLSLSREEKDAAIEAAQATRPTQSYQAPTTIAVLSIFGAITPRSGMMSDISQRGCSMDSFSAQYRQVMNDSNIDGVIINIDSPGGNVFQVPETADLIYSLKDRKPNVAVVTGMCASAALWLGVQFAELVASPSSDIGSIGVIMRHEDVSKLMSDMGVTETYIESPRDGHKSEGNPYTPLSPDSKEYLLSRTDEYYDMFLSALARGRGVGSRGNQSAVSIIDQTWGRGRMMGAQAALGLGIVDRISTMQAEVDRMAGRLAKKNGTRAQSEKSSITASTETATEALADHETDPETSLEAIHELSRQRAIRRLKLA